MKYTKDYNHRNDTTTFTFENEYKATISTDQDPINPFSRYFGDCEPPIAVLNLDRSTGTLENYDGDELNLITLLHELPLATWEDRAAINKALPQDVLDEAEASLSGWNQEDDSDLHGLATAETDTYRDAILDAAQQWEPYGWTDWQSYFDTMKCLAALAGIACHHTTSRGHSQGDCALVFTAATPAWVERVGAPPETHADQCEATADLWTAWAWGDCYQVDTITRPDGTELDDGACSGFYGQEHEQSGLMDHITEIIAADIRYCEREAAAAHEAACRDIITH
jgi:hypothetical protein